MALIYTINSTNESSADPAYTFAVENDLQVSVRLKFGNAGNDSTLPEQQ